VCNLKIKGFGTLSKIKPTPLQTIKTKHRIQGAQSVSGFMPLNEQKLQKKKWGFGVVWVIVGKREKIWKWR
jgi:hypothetical protein